PSPVPAEGAQRQPALPAELAPAQAACFELRHQTLDLGPAPPAPYHAHLFFIHAPTSSSNSSQEQMGWSDAYGLNGSSPALIVIEAHSPATELLAKNPVLLAKVVNDQQLALVHPPGGGDQHEPEWVENALRIQSSLSRLPGPGRKPSQIHADPVFGPYGVRAGGQPTQNTGRLR